MVNQDEPGDFSARKATAMIPARDVGRAVRWYEDMLGIEARSADDYGAVLALNGVEAFIYASDFAGTAAHTILTFSTADLAADMKALRERGVVFIDYDLPNLRTEDGMATFGEVKNSWCNDSEGNILGFVQGM